MQTQKPKQNTVRDAIEEKLDPNVIHSITVTKATDSSIYAMVISDRPVCDVSDGHGDHQTFPVVDLRTVLFDRDTEEVTPLDNGVWTPGDKENIGNVITGLARAQQATGSGEAPEPILSSSEAEVEVETFLDREVGTADSARDMTRDKESMERHPGIDPHRSWGYGGSPPPEAYDMAEILREAGLDPSDHLIRCKFGKKAPHSNERSGKGEGNFTGRPVEELCGNYGVEVRKRQSGLVALDTDDPEELPDMIEELPETVKISSPHGTEERCHRFYYCDDKREVAEYAVSDDDDDDINWQLMGFQWGELWLGEPFVVGVGSQLSEYACDKDGHSKNDEGGCSACSDPAGGFYEFVGETREIAEVSPEQLKQLIDDTDGEALKVGEADRAENVAQNGADEIEITEDTDTVECQACGSVQPKEAAVINEINGREVVTCKGGCQ
jgi:hypothetical protein